MGIVVKHPKHGFCKTFYDETAAVGGFVAIRTTKGIVDWVLPVELQRISKRRLKNRKVKPQDQGIT